MALTEKQARFVEEYLIDLNGTQAAIRAGYGRKNARTTAQWLHKQPGVKEHLALRMKAREERTRITQDEVVRELARMAFANIADYLQPGPDGDPYVDFSRLTREQAAALAEITVEDFKAGRGADARDVRRIKFKLADKRAALVDLGRHLGMFTDKAKTEKTEQPLDAVSDEELQAEIERLEAELARTLPRAPA